MVTMAEVSRRAGVSTATVSRVLNKPDVVDKKTLQLVRAAIRDLDYRPNAVARGLASRSSKTIGVVINRFSSSYYGRMLQGAEDTLTGLKFKTIVESSNESAEGELSAVASLLGRQCEGIVLHSDMLSDAQLRDLLVKQPKIVLMNRLLEGFEDRCVYLDNVRGGSVAADYLFDKGHREIAVVTGPETFFESEDRLKGFTAQLTRRGVTLNPAYIIKGDFRARSGRAAMEVIRTKGQSVTAVFCMNDEMAAGAIDFCLEHGISVPKTISILGFDDHEMSRFLHPKLTTVRQPLAEIGSAAGSLAHALARGTDHSENKKVFEAEVVERASVMEI
jgi:LacI family transcriptional regulator